MIRPPSSGTSLMTNDHRDGPQPKHVRVEHIGLGFLFGLELEFPIPHYSTPYIWCQDTKRHHLTLNKGEIR